MRPGRGRRGRAPRRTGGEQREVPVRPAVGRELGVCRPAGVQRRPVEPCAEHVQLAGGGEQAAQLVLVAAKGRQDAAGARGGLHAVGDRAREHGVRGDLEEHRRAVLQQPLDDGREQDGLAQVAFPVGGAELGPVDRRAGDRRVQRCAPVRGRSRAAPPAGAAARARRRRCGRRSRRRSGARRRPGRAAPRRPRPARPAGPSARSRAARWRRRRPARRRTPAPPRAPRAGRARRAPGRRGRRAR